MINKKLIKENKKLAKNFKIILIMGYKYKNEIAHIVYKNLIKSNEKVLLLKNNGYYINKKYYKLNNNLNYEILNNILKNAKEKDVKYVIICINNSHIKNNLLKGIGYNIMSICSFIGDDTKYVSKEIKKVKEVLVLNNDEKYSKIFRKKYKNVITIGNKGTYEIDRFNICLDVMKLIDDKYNKFDVTDYCIKELIKHNAHIKMFGTDLEEVENWKWSN